MHLSCAVECGSDLVNGMILLHEVCDDRSCRATVFFLVPIAIVPGMELVREIEFQSPFRDKQVIVRGNVATVISEIESQ